MEESTAQRQQELLGGASSERSFLLPPEGDDLEGPAGPGASPPGRAGGVEEEDDL